MKKINVYFEDVEMAKLKEVKGKTTWHDFIMSLTNSKSNTEKNGDND